jgi:N-acyl homoserine lactone hydrolase
MTRVLLTSFVFAACTTTTHAVARSTLGVPSSSAAMLASLEQPGPIELETVNSADWQIKRSDLINLEAEAAKRAGLSDGLEPIHVYFHVLKHPTRGTWWVDSGMERAFRDDPSNASVRGLVASVLHTETIAVQTAPADWLKTHPEGVAGVLLTHLHVDHVSGVPDLPPQTPIVSGPGEAGARAFSNLFAQGNFNRQLAGKGPLQELAFEPDASARFDGVLDLFGDGSVWALWVPGHTPGSVAYVVRTTRGPVLLTGDVCHTRWGWEHEVEPGAFTADHPKNLESLKRLRALVAEHPTIDVRLGHQALTAP